MLNESLFLNKLLFYYHTLCMLVYIVYSKRISVTLKTVTKLKFHKYCQTFMQQTDTNTDSPFQNLYQTNTDTNISFRIQLKPLPEIGSINQYLLVDMKE